MGMKNNCSQFDLAKMFAHLLILSPLLLTGCAKNVTPAPPACEIDPALARDCGYPVAEVQPDGRVIWKAVGIESEQRGESLQECTGRMRVIRRLCVPESEKPTSPDS